MQVPGQTQSLLEQIQEGVTHASHNPASLLLFSGGQTRKAAGPRSEAEGYWLLAEAANWWGTTDVRERAYTEVNFIAPSLVSNAQWDRIGLECGLAM